MTYFLDQWAQANPENERLVAQEKLIVEVTEQIYHEMELHKMKKSELATYLGRSRPYVTQLLGGNKNITLRTLADVAYAMNLSAHVRFYEHGKNVDWGPMGEVVPIRPRKVANSLTVLSVKDSMEWAEPVNENVQLCA